MGEADAFLFVARGDAVVLGDLREDRLEAVATQIETAGRAAAHTDAWRHGRQASGAGSTWRTRLRSAGCIGRKVGIKVVARRMGWSGTRCATGFARIRRCGMCGPRGGVGTRVGKAELQPLSYELVPFSLTEAHINSAISSSL
jgi:hypothetical protein